ncbi:hypothetical protein [Microbacterium sp. LWS13-1.2]|uniref:Uncharacterized protein n=1 Tax=Microbacterium sp. LWS13-1.2 TaxID=3135264 RepID=A0AAU6S9J4_9MICO
MPRSGTVTVSDAAADARGSKPYTVTDAGRRAWREWMLSPVTGGDIETIALARTFFVGLLDERSERRQVVGAIRARVESHLAELDAVARGVDAAEIPAEFADVFAFSARRWITASGRISSPIPGATSSPQASMRKAPAR